MEFALQKRLTSAQNIVAKSGHLSKKGKQNPKYTRYWFTLKGDVLSYYADPSKPYFRSGNIDLRYGISASLAEPKEKGKDVKEFFVVTDQRQYHFRADSITSAMEWVKSLQKVIFRSHNDGDSVKVSLPIENIIDVEESPIIGFADTLKIRVVDSDETYAIDEVRKSPPMYAVANSQTVLLLFLQLWPRRLQCPPYNGRRYCCSKTPPRLSLAIAGRRRVSVER